MGKKRILFYFLIASLIILQSGCTKMSGKLGTELNKLGTTQSQQPNTQTQKATVSKPTPEQVKKLPTPVVRGAYVNIWTLTNPSKLNELIEVSKTTELNTVVIDIKGDEGIVYYDSKVPLVKNIGASQSKIDIEKVIKLFHDNNIYVIGRVVCFRDPFLAKARADLSFRAKDGTLWRDYSGMPWVNPSNKENWKYIIDIAKEASDKGVDEIQFDYVRYCNEGNVKNIDFGQGFDPSQKSEVIAGFLNTAYKELSGVKKVKVSADVFGISAITTADDNILGQNMEKIAKEVDAISPMIYPSHYANIKQNKVGQIINNKTFPKPDLDPYNVVLQTMLTVKNRVEANSIKTTIRPYLQAFTASYLGNGYFQKYDAKQVREQIKAVYDCGFKEWILWDSSSYYKESYFEKKK